MTLLDTATASQPTSQHPASPLPTAPLQQSSKRTVISQGTGVTINVKPQPAKGLPGNVRFVSEALSDGPVW